MRCTLILAIAYGVFLSIPAVALDDFDHCNLPKDIHSTTVLTDLPPWIAGWIRGMGARDGPLAGDADVKPFGNPPSTRLVRAFSKSSHWVVISEQGGFAPFVRMSVYVISRDKRSTRNLTDNTPPSCTAILSALQPRRDDF